MIDLHSHILPGVDDGSKNMEESINMARQYVENGIDKVIATPHFIEERDLSIRDRNKLVLEELKSNLKKERIDLKLYLGNEIFVSPDILKYLREEKVSTLNGTRYALIETAMFDIPTSMENVIYELCLKGYTPIIAHPERNTKVQESPNILYKFIMSGALTQINLPSLEGRYGEKVEETAKILLTHNMVHFVGTDAHSPRTRSPKVKKSLEILSQIVDEDEFIRLTKLNGEAVLENKEILVEEPVMYEEKESALGRFFSQVFKNQK